MAGQYWYQQDREMSATNKRLEGTDNGKESVVLGAFDIIIIHLLGLAPEMCSDSDAP
jgi:hypothetical protein